MEVLGVNRVDDLAAPWDEAAIRNASNLGRTDAGEPYFDLHLSGPPPVRFGAPLQARVETELNLLCEDC